jgi:molybdenum cofactor cytidylyltransferase
VSRLGCAILAAGASRRLGCPKQLLPFKGNELVRHLTLEVLASQAKEVAVIVGAHGERVAAAVAGLPVTCIVNLEWREGIASSIRCAAHWANRQQLTALTLVLSDQPYLESHHLDQLAGEHAAGANIVASRYHGVIGVPALFAATAFDMLFTLKGDAGAGTLLRQRPSTRSIEWPAGEIDIDTHHDLASMVVMPQPPSLDLSAST